MSMRDVTSVWSFMFIMKISGYLFLFMRRKSRWSIAMCTLRPSPAFVAIRQHRSSRSSIKCTRSAEDKAENNVSTFFGMASAKLRKMSEFQVRSRWGGRDV